MIQKSIAVEIQSDPIVIVFDKDIADCADSGFFHPGIAAERTEIMFPFQNSYRLLQRFLQRILQRHTLHRGTGCVR